MTYARVTPLQLFLARIGAVFGALELNRLLDAIAVALRLCGVGLLALGLLRKADGA
jgi:hypothetical protein